MFVLYGFAALFFGLSYLYFKKVKRKFGNFFLSLALFINPLGYDLVVYGLNKLTDDYWMTICIMYTLAFSFFIGFIYLYRINPINHVKNKIKHFDYKIKQ